MGSSRSCKSSLMCLQAEVLRLKGGLTVEKCNLRGSRPAIDPVFRPC